MTDQFYTKVSSRQNDRSKVLHFVLSDAGSEVTALCGVTLNKLTSSRSKLRDSTEHYCKRCVKKADEAGNIAYPGLTKFYDVTVPADRATAELLLAILMVVKERMSLPGLLFLSASEKYEGMWSVVIRVEPRYNPTPSPQDWNLTALALRSAVADAVSFIGFGDATFAVPNYYK